MSCTSSPTSSDSVSFTSVSNGTFNGGVRPFNLASSTASSCLLSASSNFPYNIYAFSNALEIFYCTFCLPVFKYSCSVAGLMAARKLSKSSNALTVFSIEKSPQSLVFSYWGTARKSLKIAGLSLFCHRYWLMRVATLSSISQLPS